MKLAITTSLAALALTLGACGTTGPDRYQTELAKLEADCTAKDGVLQTTGATTGQASRDYACRITQATRIPPAR
ncbi:MAG: hypothetical protein ACK4I0_03135 [Brevundimonas sp.]|uniref:hypothetical protein n=1 Tax=Brevundimonas sp. TaxID=1871086 RepID=UPI00391B2E3F